MIEDEDLIGMIRAAATERLPIAVMTMQEMMEQAKKNVANGSATEPATVPAAPPHVMTMQEMMEAAKKKVADDKAAEEAGKANNGTPAPNP